MNVTSWENWVGGEAPREAPSLANRKRGCFLHPATPFLQKVTSVFLALNLQQKHEPVHRGAACENP